MADNSPLEQTTKVEAFIDLLGLQSIVPHPKTRLTPLKGCDFALKIMNRNAWHSLGSYLSKVVLPSVALEKEIIEC